ncbi:hypothetical protein PL11201_490068 [Planktothrix sp. PCC 11201]|uniref:hypothetical protein n=1 Tax=Planktothrix sp. PCC 11201 TaxID=1729650 RepID=UPI0009114691|nr:hypothetical protein [Planktothrix sp. PCC 11201]SKB13333.1 hypothetical protein PL11201_490068 [Planktothrix sp. PCC 11201]
MTTYARDIRVGNKNPVTVDYKQPRQGLGISNDTGGSLANRGRTPRSSSGGTSNAQPNQIGGSNPQGNWGRDSWARSPKGTTTRTALDVTAKTVGRSERTASDRARVGLGNAARDLGKAAKTVGKVGGKLTPGVGINSKGDVEVGLRVGGAGIALSVKGDLSLGVPGLSVVIDPKNLSNTTVDLGFGTATVEQTREGCDITVTVTMFGKIVNQDTRKADNCSEPEPTPTPTPSPTPGPPDPSNNSDGENRQPRSSPLAPDGFYGIYTQTASSFRKTSGNTDPRFNYQISGSTAYHATRLDLHDDPYSDIWKISYTTNSVTTYPDYPSINGSFSDSRFIYFCQYPSSLVNQGIVSNPSGYNNWYFYQNSRIITYPLSMNTYYNPSKFDGTVYVTRFGNSQLTFDAGIITGDASAINWYLGG